MRVNADHVQGTLEGQRHGLPSSTNLHRQPRSSATAGHECLCACASCLCLSVMPCQPYPCRYYFPSRFVAYKTASTCLHSGISSRVAACLSVSAFGAFCARDRQSLHEISAASATAQYGQRSDISQPSSHISVYLQICNYVLLFASHICFLRSSSQSVCLRIAFECHFGVVYLSANATSCWAKLPCRTVTVCSKHRVRDITAILFASCGHNLLIARYRVVPAALLSLGLCPCVVVPAFLSLRYPCVVAAFTRFLSEKFLRCFSDLYA